MLKSALTATLLAGVAASAVSLATPLAAKEGMFTPDQLPLIAEDLRATGLEIAPEALSDLTGFPMGAIVSLGGCSASFVSPEGLVVTNHHCARGSVQYNSTAENNYLVDRLSSPRPRTDELPAAPGSRIYVTVAEVTDVTDRDAVEGTERLAPAARYDTGRAAPEGHHRRMRGATPVIRCLVASFYGGAQYKLIKRLESARRAAGLRAGGLDRQSMAATSTTGSGRATPATSPSTAPMSRRTVRRRIMPRRTSPTSPEHHLKVSAAGLENGDFVMAAGYPGSTSRYATLAEVEDTFGWQLPDLQVGAATTSGSTRSRRPRPQGRDARVKYESRLAGLNNHREEPARPDRGRAPGRAGRAAADARGNGAGGVDRGGSVACTLWRGAHARIVRR